MKKQLIIATAMIFLVIAVCGAASAAEGDTTQITPPDSNADSGESSVSDDGNWITYASDASNIVPDDTADDYSDIFLYNCQEGTTIKITPHASNEGSFNPSISGDGNWITFQSLASNIVPGDTDDHSDIFLYNRLTGVTTKVTPLASNGGSGDPSISADGNWITYDSPANNIVPGDTVDNEWDVFLFNRLTGVTTKVTPLASNGGSDIARISADGNWITYHSYASNIVPGDTADGNDDIFLYNCQEGTTIKITPHASNGNSWNADISGDGQWITYYSLASNIVPGDTADGWSDIFLYNRLTGITTKITLATSNGDSFYPYISGDGNWITYTSRATNIVPGDTADTYYDVFLYNCLTGVTTKVTPTASNGHGYASSISGDGNWITYNSVASNIVPGDTANTWSDVFLYDNPFVVTRTPTPSNPPEPTKPSGNEVNAVAVTEGTVGMQETGLPIVGLIIAILMLLGGLVVSKRK